jgi:hypothetical protein
VKRSSAALSGLATAVALVAGVATVIVALPLMVLGYVS